MNLRFYISFLIVAVLFPFGITRAQILPTACVNGKARYGVSPLPGSTIVWSVSGGTIIKDYNDSVDIQWGNTNSSSNFLSYREINASGCSSAVETDFIQLNSPYIDLGSILQICAGEDTLLDATGSFSSYRWSDGSISSTLRASAAGIYWIDVTDAAGCTYRDSVVIAVNQIPKVTLANDIKVCAPNTYTIDASTPTAFSYLWFNGSTSRYYDAIEGDSLIWVKVSDEYGCTGYDSTIILSCNWLDKIPNAFTPDGDQTNDVWRLDLLKSKYPKMQVKIYDRWGRLVFVSDRGYGTPWNGSSNGNILPMDTYYYIIDFGNGQKEGVGSVAIIR